MDLLKKDAQMEVAFSEKELLLIQQSLNEVCNGFAIADFDRVIGNLSVARAELEKLSAAVSEGGGRTMPISPDQLLIYRNAVRVVCREIEDWEFSTRVGGVSKTDAQKLLNELDVHLPS